MPVPLEDRSSSGFRNVMEFKTHRPGLKTVFRDSFNTATLFQQQVHKIFLADYMFRPCQATFKPSVGNECYKC